MTEKGGVWHEGSDEKEDYKGSSPCRNFQRVYTAEQISFDLKNWLDAWEDYVK